MERISEQTLWAGTEATLDHVLFIQDKIVAFYDQDNSDDADRNLMASQPRLYTKQGQVGVIQIEGSLLPGSHPAYQFFGVTGYGEIREALIYGASDPEVKELSLVVNSGGGAVSGVSDVAHLVRTVSEKVKPVKTYVSGNMASAAYWIGSAASKVEAAPTSIVGSIGVLSTVASRKRQLESEGIDAKVIRAGKYKALTNPVEGFSEEGLAQSQQRVDSLYKVFLNDVANFRGRTPEYTDAVMAQGREFVGTEALAVGLIDAVSSYDSFFNKVTQGIESKGTPNKSPKRKEDFTMSKEAKEMALTDEVIAQIAEGAAPIDVGADADAEASNEVVAETAPIEAKPSLDVVSTLLTELKETQHALMQAKMDLANTQSDLAEAQALVQPLATIVGKSVALMRTGLSLAKVDFAGMSADQILAEYQSVHPKYVASFKVGGAAAVNPEELNTNKPASAAIDSNFINRLKAVKG